MLCLLICWLRTGTPDCGAKYFNSYCAIGADWSECIGSTGKEMVASYKKHSNIVLAFLLPHRKERIYSVTLQSTEKSKSLCFPWLFIHTHKKLGKQGLSIPELAITICTNFLFTHVHPSTFLKSS